MCEVERHQAKKAIPVCEFSCHKEITDKGVGREGKKITKNRALNEHEKLEESI